MRARFQGTKFCECWPPAEWPAPSGTVPGKRSSSPGPARSTNGPISCMMQAITRLPTIPSSGLLEVSSGWRRRYGFEAMKRRRGFNRPSPRPGDYSISSTRASLVSRTSGCRTAGRLFAGMRSMANCSGSGPSNRGAGANGIRSDGGERTGRPYGAGVPMCPTRTSVASSPMGTGSTQHWPTEPRCQF